MDKDKMYRLYVLAMCAMDFFISQYNNFGSYLKDNNKDEYKLSYNNIKIAMEESINRLKGLGLMMAKDNEGPMQMDSIIFEFQEQVDKIKLMFMNTEKENGVN